MKTIKNIGLLLVLMVGITAQADPLKAAIQAKVRSCMTLPYTVKPDGVKVFHHMISHCADVTNTVKGQARIVLDNEVFNAVLVAAPDSDDDLYDVDITSADKTETTEMRNVFSYGDVFLAILEGDTRGIPEVFYGNPADLVVGDNL